MQTTVPPADERISVDYLTFLDLLDIRASARETISPEHEWTDAERLDWLRDRMAAYDKPQR